MSNPQRWGALPLGEPVAPQGDGWAAMGDAQPRVCAGCGEQVMLREGGWFTTMEPRKTWHHACKRKVKR